jgi:hypothetical protein
VRRAVIESGLLKRVSCHSFRHSFATYLPEAGYAIRTVRKLLGHSEVRTEMIYTSVLNRGGRGVKSTADDVRAVEERRYAEPDNTPTTRPCSRRPLVLRGIPALRPESCADIRRTGCLMRNRVMNSWGR